MTVCCPTCGSKVERIDPAKAVAAARLGTRERAVAELLAAHFGQFVSTEATEAHVYRNDRDGGPLNARTVIEMAVHRMKPKLLVVGLAIDSVRGHGAGRRLTWATEKASVA